ncbi:3-phosphoinositide dependent protein kinase-1 [Physocladia obscura]|uniref:non-specific serine/threonine protein kinase n=1 Tax=Physocladia obscura TaxID=109957 RepID=A0AAD5TA58_9FUNG|nr:3-phosphoinositide dependent protein kinase-1 [Physocladia obscura]
MQNQQQPQLQHSNNTTAVRKPQPKDFSFGRILGEGSYATVVAASEKATGRLFAIKILDQKFIIKEKKIKYVFIERDALNATNHPFIVKSATSLYFAMEFVPNGDLLELMKTRVFSPEAIKFYTAEIIVAVDYLHSCGILHRDIKPENILISVGYHIKLCDFGSAKLPPKPGDSQHPLSSPSEQSSSASFVGTAEYCPPELLSERAASPASDIWAIACIFFYLHLKKPPFKGGNDYQTFQKILALQYELPETFDAEGRKLIERVLLLDPTARASIAEIKLMAYFETIKDWNTLHLQDAPELPRIPVDTKHKDQFTDDELAEWYGKSLNIAETVSRNAAGSGGGTGQSMSEDLFEDADSSADSLRYPYEVEDGVDSEIEAPAYVQEVLAVDPKLQREEALHNQRSSVLAPLLKDNELVVMVGTVARRKGLFSKKVGLMLTDLPRE